MPTPIGHALLSASSAHRWLVCTAAPRFEAMFPAETSEYAQEGTLAHSICELHVQREFMKLHGRTFKTQLSKLQENPLYKPEMLTTAGEYVQYLKEKRLSFDSEPHMNVEVRVDLSDWIPDGFGTCDCVLIGGDTLHITDYKHGKGVPVSAVENPQMRLYALGALKLYQMVYGDTIKRVSMGICQPRITSDVSEERLTTDELLAWGEWLKPIAQKAYNNEGEMVPGEHCRFCRARAVCRARAKHALAAEDFIGCVSKGKAEELHEPLDPTARQVLGLPRVLTNTEIADCLRRAATFEVWYRDLKEYALKALLKGEEIPGYKAVEGKRGNRAFVDQQKALDALIAAGYERDALYSPKTLAELEKVVGKKTFGALVGNLIVQPAGGPALAESTDKRPDYKSAASDFAGVSAHE